MNTNTFIIGLVTFICSMCLLMISSGAAAYFLNNVNNTVASKPGSGLAYAGKPTTPTPMFVITTMPPLNKSY